MYIENNCVWNPIFDNINKDITLITFNSEDGLTGVIKDKDTVLYVLNRMQVIENSTEKLFLMSADATNVSECRINITIVVLTSSELKVKKISASDGDTLQVVNGFNTGVIISGEEHYL